MICPRCNRARLIVQPDKSSSCSVCHLHRRPPDRIVQRKETNFWVLNRNISRTPPGSLVEVIDGNTTLSGTFGVFKGNRTSLLRGVNSKVIIASSGDVEDLVTLIAENEWYVEGPQKIIDLLNILSGC